MKLAPRSDIATAAAEAISQIASRAIVPTSSTALSTRTMTSRMSSITSTHTSTPTAMADRIFWPNGTAFTNKTLINNPNLCTVKTCPLVLGPIPYIPSHAGNSLYLTAFLLILLIQIAVGIRHRTWGFLAAFVGGELLETIGYAARIHLHFNPFSMNSFLINLTCLTIAPCFLCAGIYLCFSRIVVIYGENLARFKARMYSIIFIGSDIFSLLLQAGGSIIVDASKPKSAGRQSGINLMVAGLIFQLISLTIFIALACDFAWRSFRRGPPVPEAFRRFSQLHLGFAGFVLALMLGTLLIYARCTYRVAELLGPNADSETLFMIDEGGTILAASIGLTLMHPGFVFRGFWSLNRARDEANGKVEIIRQGADGIALRVREV